MFADSSLPSTNCETGLAAARRSTMSARYSVRSSTNPAPMDVSTVVKALPSVLTWMLNSRGVELLAFASRAGVLHDEALHRGESRRDPPAGTAAGPPEHQLSASPPATLPFTAFSGPRSCRQGTLLVAGRSSARFAGHRARTPRTRRCWRRVAAVGRASDVQPDEPGFNRRLDHVRRRPRVAGALADALAPHRPAFLGRLAEPRLHVLDRLSLAHAVHQGRRRSDRAGPAASLRSFVSTPCPKKITAGRSASA